MSPTEPTRRVPDLSFHRRRRGLTQAELGALLGVTQQAIAKWEQSEEVPAQRLKELAKGLRVSAAALVAIDDGPDEEREERLQARLDEHFADHVMACFGDVCLHYQPTSEELSDFWRSIQEGPIAHLSAGPVQVLLNVGAANRIDLAEDPDLKDYDPRSIVDGDELDEEEGEPRYWFNRGQARVYVRGRSEPYSDYQSFFGSVIDGEQLTHEQLVELAEDFDHSRPTENSIFDLFYSVLFSAELDESEFDKGQRLHPDSLHLFNSTDSDGAPTRTWLHTRDILAIEVPTVLWETYQRAVDARLKEFEESEQRKRGKKSPESVKKTK